MPSCADVVARETMTGHALIATVNSWRASVCVCVCVCVSLGAVCNNKSDRESVCDAVVTGEERDEDPFISHFEQAVSGTVYTHTHTHTHTLLLQIVVCRLLVFVSLVLDSPPLFGILIVSVCVCV